MQRLLIGHTLADLAHVLHLLDRLNDDTVLVQHLLDLCCGWGRSTTRLLLSRVLQLLLLPGRWWTVVMRWRDLLLHGTLGWWSCLGHLRRLLLLTVHRGHGGWGALVCVCVSVYSRNKWRLAKCLMVDISKTTTQRGSRTMHSGATWRSASNVTGFSPVRRLGTEEFTENGI